MDCVIKITKGPEEGQEFRCSTTETVIGRSPRSQIRLSSASVSFEHAAITRNIDDFYIENLSAGGTFVNDERITGKIRLRVKDVLRFGQETVARVEAVPAGGGATATRKWVIFAMIASVVLLITALLWTTFAPTVSGPQINNAYPRLETFVEDQVAAHKLSVKTLQLMREAWRLEMSHVRSESQHRWRDLNVLLAAQESSMGFEEALRDPHNGKGQALTRLSNTDTHAALPTEDELKAGLIQFVTRMSQ